MRKLLLTVLAVVLTGTSVAMAGNYPRQDFPEAPLKVDGELQRSRLAEASFGYRTGPSECVSQGVLGDGAFPRPRQVESDPDQRLRFRLNAESRPKVSLRYWTEVDDDGFAQGSPTPVPIEVAERKPNGDFILIARVDATGDRYLRLSSYWKGKGFCGGQEFLLEHYSITPSSG